MDSIKNLTIFAGVNGAGKSTLFYSENAGDLGIRLNSDEIIRANGLDWKSTSDQLYAGKVLLRLQADCFEKGISFNRETTLSSNEIFKTIQQAKNLGYRIHLRYIGVNDPEIAKQRVAKRVSMGGHGVSPETIDRRFQSSYDNFLRIFPLCDTINIYDNSGNSMVLISYCKNGKITRNSIPCSWADSLLEKMHNP